MKRIGLLLFLALPIFPSAFSQSNVKAAGSAQATVTAMTTAAATAPAQVVTLGDSAVTLAGPWKFEPGDSPWAKGAPEWASPALDDAGWARMDLHSTSGALDPAYGNGGYLTGWTARGFPHLSGFAWYRLRVHVASAAGPLWLKMPDHVDDAYQVYANGRYVGEFGQFTASGVKCYRSHPLIFELPPPDGNGDILLAIRFYMEPTVLVMSSSGDSGGMHQTPVAGMRSQIELLLSQAHAGRVLSQMVPVFVAFLMLVMAAGAFRLWLLERPQTTYLWLTLALVLEAIPIAAMIGGLFSYAYTQDTLQILEALFLALGPVCWIFFWRRWFKLARNRALDLLIILAAAVVMLVVCIRFSPSAALDLLAYRIAAGADMFLAAALFVSLAQGARKDRMGALAALPPVILVAISLFSYQLINWFHIRTSFFPFGVAVGVGDIAGVLIVLVVGALTARRFLHSQVRQRLAQQTIEQEMEQARELQQHVLIPEPVNSPVFRVEAEYLPAQTVGGDFFQMLTKPDGTLLVVIGDVSGKGVSAAMLVAVLVGAIRTRSDESFEPASMLATLNQRLLGRAGGHFATCVAAEIQPDGTMGIANAGHLPPYLNGKEMELEGSLPLGLSSDAEIPAQAFTLQPGDRLTFMTDGVVEATNAAKELFGFERTREISGQSAASIAARARSFGQEDDITVVSVEFAGSAESSVQRAVVGSGVSKGSGSV